MIKERILLLGVICFMCCDTQCSHGNSCIMSVPVFKGMNHSDLHILQQVIHSRAFKKGEFIFREGEDSETLLIVHSGLIKLTKVSPDGKEQIVRLLFPGDFFGLFSLLREEKHYTNAEATCPTEICFISKRDFLKAMESNANLAYQFLLAVNDRLFEADESVGLLGLLEVEQRLARVLIQFHDKMHAENGTFNLPISKKELAGLVGTTPESISRKLMSLSSQKLIKTDGKRQIEILELEKLKHLAGMS